MPIITEANSFDASVPLIDTTDPVLGGDGTTPANKQAQALADRTRWIYNQITSILGRLTTIEGELAATPTTQAAGDDSTDLATTAFVHRAQGGIAIVDCAPGGVGNGNITLTGDQWGHAILILTGARTADGNVIFPDRSDGDLWLVVNNTTGAYKMTCKTAGGSGVKVAQGRSKFVYSDETNIKDAETDLSIRPRIVTSATTLAPGDDVIADQRGGAFALTAPAAPADGDQFRVRGNFGTSNMTVLRNGHKFYDQTATPQAADLVIDRNNASDVFTFIAADDAWLVTQG